MAQVALHAAVLGHDGNKKIECPFCNSYKNAESVKYKTRRGCEKESGRLGKAIWRAFVNGDEGMGYAKCGHRFVYKTDSNKPYRSSLGSDGLGKEGGASWGVDFCGLLGSCGECDIGDGVREVGGEAHHVIPGVESMDGSHFEIWACADEGKIFSDIGYSVDGPANGIFLPGYPKGSLCEKCKYSVAKKVMVAVERQFHTGRHCGGYGDMKYGGDSVSVNESVGIGKFKWVDDNEKWSGSEWDRFEARREKRHKGKSEFEKKKAPDRRLGVSSDGSVSYAQEARNRCDFVGALATSFTMNGGGCGKDNCRPREVKGGKSRYNPPYAIIDWINCESKDLAKRISGEKSGWCDYVSAHAYNYYLE
ncbi:AHH domain-containing protein [Pseudenhygromyxa sp. WMMC2535]|uniref:AHH domain-containing protein n=1 Tax=Pseudenhygromyxa sp. WMMC2535 TaxID=2712867 RepID=UPI001558068D|nr:AHH domain-containing protein [Pseudenhygromyxa sp. WMMC2535]NVB42847.1 AHH domain-containing protein [Pseudenhygromyxa sp. WMMC2535]